jgi:MEMO1 family protein
VLVAGAIVPHAPLLVASRAPNDDLDRVRAACAQVSFEGAEAVVIMSPHGARTGVYRAVRGSLQPFGVPGPSTAARVDGDLAGELARTWGQPVLDGDVDHGIHVALSLVASVGTPVVAACVAEDVPATEAEVVATGLATALRDSGRRLAFVASGHTSSALSPRAPLGHRAEAEDAATAFVSALEHGRGVDEAARRLNRAGASCGAAPLVAFAELWPDVPTSVVAYEHPFGVGYLVAHRSP